MVLRFFFILFFAITSCLISASANGKNETVEQMLQKELNVAEKEVVRKQFTKAKNRLGLLLKQDDKLLVDSELYTDILLLLADCEISLGSKETASTILAKLDPLTLNPDGLIKMSFIQVKIAQANHDIENAWKILQTAQKVIAYPEWSKEQKNIYTQVKTELNLASQAILSRAERLFKATLYQESLIAFEELIYRIEQGLYPEVEEMSDAVISKIYYQMAEVFFETEQFDRAADLLEYKVIPMLPQHKKGARHHETYYLLARCYQGLKQYQKAITSLQEYLTRAKPHELVYYHQSQWLLGLNYYHLGQWESAINYIQPFTTQIRDKALQTLAYLYLAKIQIHLKKYDLIDSLLAPVCSQLPENDPLLYEASFLKGQAKFLSGQYEEAKSLFEGSLPHKNRQQAGWTANALYYLGWCYAKLAEETSIGIKNKTHYLQQAENFFYEVIHLNQDEKAYLALCELIATQKKGTEPGKVYMEIQPILSKALSHFSLEGQVSAYQLLALHAPSLEESHSYYEILTDTKYEKMATYPEHWLLKGLNEYKKAQLLGESNQGAAALEKYEEAIFSLGKAYQQVSEDNPEKWATSIKVLCQALFHSQQLPHQMKALDLLNDCIYHRAELWQKLKYPDEILYLKGLIASKITGSEKNVTLKEEAIAAFEQVISSYPNGPFVDTSLNALGALYFELALYEKAEKIFMELGNYHPESEYAADAWFWASQSAERQKKDSSYVQFLKKQVYERYPDSRYAAQAYYRQYYLSDYLQGDEAAITHLKSMIHKFPHSPFIIASHYILGLDNKQDRKTDQGVLIRRHNCMQAAEHFEQVIVSFDHCLSQHLISAENLEFFATLRYKSIIENALIKLQTAKDLDEQKRKIFTHYTLELLQGLIQDFENPHHPLASIFKKEGGFFKIYEEGMFLFAQSHLLNQNYSEAETALLHLIDACTKESIQEGYYLARAWFELGKIAVKKNDFDLALSYLDKSQFTNRGHYLSTDQRLEISLQQSVCYEKLKEYDKAMLILSKVINEDTASSMRLKAMYLRAEIYEKQQRPELAIKQLEAISKKGGKWSIKAKNKLKEKYAI